MHFTVSNGEQFALLDEARARPSERAAGALLSDTYLSRAPGARLGTWGAECRVLERGLEKLCRINGMRKSRPLDPQLR